MRNTSHDAQSAPARTVDKRPLNLLLFLVCAAVMAWTLLNLHPASGTTTTPVGGARLNLSDKLDVYAHNASADALGDMAQTRKIYTLQESATKAPAPNPAGFGTTYDPATIADVIQRATPLLDGQAVAFDPTVEFVPGEPIRYYLDDTILVIAWKEYINDSCCTLAEVKIAHGSQLRRKLAEDVYGSSVQFYATELAKTVNAVIASNADYYAYRDQGITVYQRKLYRNKPALVDTCFFTASGDMLFSHAGELMGEGEAQRFIDDNDVVFSCSFGPILVEDGVVEYHKDYVLGEINIPDSRTCIAMTDSLHYLLMTVNETVSGRPRININQLADFISSKNVIKAYALDGGQTSELVMMGGPINRIDFGCERTVSDIIYFATAIPEEVWK
ncbi:MAG: phosphodiester glycosidase family protein [Oscillospiraceae bacterium]|nr:phosphodiester glycosidase family protein [Oscillospiraceae bacterium]